MCSELRSLGFDQRNFWICLNKLIQRGYLSDSRCTIISPLTLMLLKMRA